MSRAQIIQPAVALQAVGADGAAVTLTIPAPPAGSYIHVTATTLAAYNTAARVGGAVPVVVTSTNLGGASTHFATAAAIGSAINNNLGAGVGMAPWRSDTPGAEATIVAPATVGILWRLTVNYYYSGVR